MICGMENVDECRDATWRFQRANKSDQSAKLGIIFMVAA